MLIQRLRSNHPAALVLLPFFAALIWIPAWINPVSPDPGQELMPLMELVRSLLQELPLLGAFIAFTLVLVQSFLFKSLLERRNIFTEYANLPAYVYFLFSSLFYHQLHLSPLVISNTLLLFALNRMMSIHNQRSIKSHVFDTAFYISIASLFYQPSVFLFLALWVALIIIRSFAWRDWVISSIGLIIPYAYTWVYYFWIEKTGIFYRKLFSIQAYFPEITLSIDVIAVITAGGMLLLSALFFVIRNLPTQTVRVRHLLSVLLWHVVFCLGTLYINDFDYIATYSLMILPFAVFTNNQLLTIKRKWVANLWLWFLIAVVFIHHYWQWVEHLILKN